MSIENLLVSHILVFLMFTRMGFCVRVIRLSSFSRVDPLSLPVPILSRRPHFLFEFPAPCSRSAGNDRQCMGSHGTGVVSLWRSRPLFLIRVSSRVSLLLSRPLLSCVALVASCCIRSCLCLSYFLRIKRPARSRVLTLQSHISALPGMLSTHSIFNSHA